jgi:hypothetical protein
MKKPTEKTGHILILRPIKKPCLWTGLDEQPWVTGFNNSARDLAALLKRMFYTSLALMLKL